MKIIERNFSNKICYVFKVNLKVELTSLNLMKHEFNLKAEFTALG